MTRATSLPEPQPSLKVTRYERVSSGLISVVWCLAAAVLILFLMWSGLEFKSSPKAIPVQMLEPEDPGGSEDGTPGESLLLESSLPERADATTAENVPEEKTDLQEMLDKVTDQEQVVEIDQQGDPTQVAPTGEGGAPQFQFATPQTGKPGSLRGTGTKRGWGYGTGKGGFPREMRWLVGFSDHVTVKEYARQLDTLGIELGALLPDGKIVYVSNLSSSRPTVRESTSGKDEKRLYFTWRGGSRRLADLQLLKSAGVNAENAVVMQFYDPKTEEQLAQLERAFSTTPVAQVRRTYFEIEEDGKGYKFVVTRQVTYQDTKRF